MENRFLTVILALGLVTVTVPASANHLSVGGEDAAGIRETADELPDDPSVEGDQVGDRSDPYGLGTDTDCQEADESELSAEEAQKAADSRAFCGQLAYHQGNSQLFQRSPPDQDLPDPENLISKFDIVRDGRAGLSSLSYCYVFCGFLPTGSATFEAVHTVGASLDLTEDPQTADRKDGDRYQTTSYILHHPSANAIVESNTDTWRMNGWAIPQRESFAGYMEGPNGEEVDPERLNELFTKAKEQFTDQTFPDGDTRADLCGFSPDLDISINAAGQGICEVDFTYVSDGEDFQDGGDFKDGYNNEPCKSPTYICGANDEYWGADLVCSTSSCTTPTLGDVEYIRYHWVVAPTQSDCTGQQEPGFKTNPTTGELPYLAHDLDVFVPPTSANGIDATEGVAATDDYALEATLGAIPDIPDVQDPELPDLPETPADDLIEELVVGQDNRALKPAMVEPNALGTHGTGLTEDSQTETADAPSLESGKCSTFSPQQETPETNDDWVNIVDMSDVVRGTTTTGGLTGGGPYNNTAENQDDTNHDGPIPFYTIGKVGMFRDANDNGEYDQADVEQQFDSIQSVGAYPLFWDMRVDDNGQIDTDAGCTFGFGQTRLPQSMANAGYGPNTGLVEAIYLKEPTVASFEEQVQEFPEGNNIFLLESQSIHVLREQNPGGPADTFVDEIVTGLQDHKAIPDGATPVSLADVFDAESRLFDDQCSEDTGGFSSNVNLLHDCRLDCSGDTIVTGYLAELTDDQNQIGTGDGELPAFEPNGEDGVHVFQQTTALPGSSNDFLAWTDVDPFDGNPNRNDDTDHSPPT